MPQMKILACRGYMDKFDNQNIFYYLFGMYEERKKKLHIKFGIQDWICSVLILNYIKLKK